MSVRGAPDHFERGAGVRIWRVAPTLLAQLGGLLWAPNVKEPWPTGEEYAATCPAHPDHSPPVHACGCGIYAFYAPEQAAAGGYWPDEGGPFFTRLVAGVIGAAGTVDLHTHGLLAARVTVEAIFTAGAPDEDLPMPRQVIADAYGAALINSEEYEEFCAERGLVILSSEVH